MPQNGIYHVGIAALAKGLSTNAGLRILNLNDNTVGLKGTQALVAALSNFQCLESLNLGDCLIKTNGALVLADALGTKGCHASLTELNLSQNEIHARAVDSLAHAVADKLQLSSLQLDGNAFGNNGIKRLRELLTTSERIEALGSLAEDESEDEEESDGEAPDNEAESDDSKENAGVTDGYIEQEEPIIVERIQKKVVDVAEFLKAPTGENLLLLQGDKGKLFIDHAKVRLSFFFF